ncbi:hypothetical protein FR483_n563L [Paramecium bursaria Chlorella virus FR483]|uniref:Uncharacterized protein n563L n=1 Tax=Paramecium bursaria Chlorella virus FR483 TaxID=399781 RepID=A7J7R7_PBCVF|nr:hypothetical protein FR483_n563L [Paramecium bursaria Chlorella virus FR483]ABT15848.1 hypothetical protein FR483_n563L [Paramecium bursaria Chlorella virus FR483]
MSPLSTIASVRTYEEVSPVILLANTPMKNSTRPKMPEITLPVIIRMLQYLDMLSIVHYAHISFFVDINIYRQKQLLCVFINRSTLQDMILSSSGHHTFYSYVL